MSDHDFDIHGNQSDCNAEPPEELTAEEVATNNEELDAEVERLRRKAQQEAAEAEGFNRWLEKYSR
jgi:hypothetical protein